MNLSPRPSMEYLKKQAKRLLKERRRNGEPELKLHEAQLALAKSYGFEDWPALINGVAEKRAEGGNLK